MNKVINIRIATATTLAAIKRNLTSFTEKVKNEPDNQWITKMIPGDLYVTMTYKINDFSLQPNYRSKDRDIDYENGMTLYRNLKDLPRYILVDIKFWLWLILDKFYQEAVSFMPINKTSTIEGHWLDGEGQRRSLFFNVLARLFFRVERTIMDDDVTLTKWIFENPLRFRELSWRTYSDNKDIVIGVLKGCKRFVEEDDQKEPAVYAALAKQIGILGSATVLDAYSRDELADYTYSKMHALANEGEANRKEESWTS